MWGRSSAGRASRSQCEGQEFDPPRLHQLKWVYSGHMVYTKTIWWPGADKIAGSDFGHAKRARRVQARDGLHLSTTDTHKKAIWWPGAESNHRHADFQSAALPTELPGHQMTLIRSGFSVAAYLAASRPRYPIRLRPGTDRSR